jgi:hypothetical protein
MNIKHIIKIIIIFIIRLICSVHHCTWTPSLQEWINCQNRPFNAFILGLQPY